MHGKNGFLISDELHGILYRVLLPCFLSRFGGGTGDSDSDSDSKKKRNTAHLDTLFEKDTRWLPIGWYFDWGWFQRTVSRPTLPYSCCIEPSCGMSQIKRGRYFNQMHMYMYITYTQVLRGCHLNVSTWMR